MHHKKLSTKLIFAHILIYALFILPALGAQQLPLLLQERYLMAHIGLGEEDVQLGYTVFNGDYPVLVHADTTELSIYAGSPLFIPAFLSGGSTNQIGYLDAYRSNTPLALLSGGWRTDLLSSGKMRNEGFFASWGWRMGIVSGGLSYHFGTRTPVGYLGLSFDQVGLSMSASPDFAEATAIFRTDASWSLSTSFAIDRTGKPTFGIGIGISRKDYPADAMLDSTWDVAIAHRGSLEEAPENSMEAFEHALEQPHYVAIETDIQMAADGNFVLIHDPVLLRYSHGFEKVADLTTEQLQDLDMGSWFDEDFAGTQVMDLSQLAALANQHPDVYWLLELKHLIWDEETALRFLRQVDEQFDHPEKVAFYAISREMMELMQRLTGRPVGLQLDTVKMMFYYSDHLLPLMKAEYRAAVEGSDFYTVLSSKYDRQELLVELSEETGIPVMLWNFHDIITGYIPKAVRQYPLGMPKMVDGKVLLDER